MCFDQDEIIRRRIKALQEEMVYHYNIEQDMQEEKVQSLSQQIDKLVNCLLKASIKKSNNPDPIS